MDKKEAPKSADQILTEAAQTFRQRNAVYKDNYKHIGKVMSGFFPNGLTLRTEEDFVRFHLFILMQVKGTRYTQNWEAGHQDSIRDATVYAAMLEAVDGEIDAVRSEGMEEIPY